jgi:hypothetical protein
LRTRNRPAPQCAQVALVVLLTLLAVAPSATSPATAASPPKLFLSTRGSDLGPCTRTAPCATFDHAFFVARPGTIVEVRTGTYGSQSIRPVGGRGTGRVVFRPAPGAKVTLAGRFEVGGAHLELRNMRIVDLEVPRTATDVIFRNVRANGLFMQGPSAISFVGGEVSCGACPFHPHLDDAGPPDYAPPRKILFDGVSFHDWQAASADQHTECLQILAGDGITIRNSVFKNCATAKGGRGATGDLQISWFGRGPKTRNVLLENNFFYPSGNYYAIQSGDYTNLDFRYNSISGPVLVGGGWGDGTPVEFVGNVMRLGDCKAPHNGPGRVAPFVFRYNVIDGGTCGATDVNAPSGFVDAHNNLHLRPGAAAINRGDPRSYPRRDIDGQRRPKGGRPDAGADEAR